MENRKASIADLESKNTRIGVDKSSRIAFEKTS